MVFFLGGIPLICTGILGEYLGRMSEEIKQRPLYLVDRRWGARAVKAIGRPITHTLSNFPRYMGQHRFIQ
jgi:hypothetical protein